MTKYSKILLFSPILVLFALGITPAKAHAFTLTLGEEQYAVPSNSLNDWRGYFKISTHTNLKSGDQPYQVLIADYLGLPVSKVPTQTKNYSYNPSKVYEYINGLSKKIDQEASEPNLEITNGKVENFTPPKDGITVDVFNSSLAALNSLSEEKDSSELDVSKVTPHNSLASMNDLGINELIAEGVSNYSGSPSNRKHNIAVGVSKMKGVIVKPGEEFSFNKYLGPVEAEEGYLPELVIKGDKGTIPELGGGLCQVSSTTFRAAMKAGLPITQRRNHAYAVKYYAPQGTDATIYPGVIDLKFINDTPGSILIWPEIKEGSNLTFDFYGTKDDRQVTLDTPVQFDKKADGSMKATWTRTITKNGVTKSETFKSTYQPPALFHKQEQFVPATPPTPEPTPTIGNSTEPTPTGTSPQTPAPKN